MLNKIRRKLSTKDNKKITSNFLYLSVVQAANFLLPLLTFPYLVRTLGIEQFGSIMFAQAFIVYFSMIADYGFNLSGTREISIHRNNNKKIEQIFSSIMIARFWLIVIGFITMNIIVFSFEKFSQNWELYYLTYLMVIGTALFPVWFFQGMEKMKYISILSLVAKIFFTLTIFILVSTPDDYLLVPLINSLGYIFVGIVSLWLIRKDFSITIKYQRYKRIAMQFKRGWNIFISKISINLYTATNTFLLGIFTNDATVGYYAIADKVVRIVTSIFVPFYQAIYPHIVKLVKHSKDDANKFLKKVFKVVILISSLIWIILFSFALPLFTLVFGGEVEHSVELFKILSPLIIILPVAYLLFNIVLLSYKMDTYFAKIYVVGAIVNLMLVILFFQLIESKSVGISLALLFSELTITSLAGYVLFKSKKKYGER